MKDRLPNVMFVLLLLSRRLRGRIWFHNEIHFLQFSFVCWFVIDCWQVKLIWFFLIVSFMNVQRSAMCFLFKKNNNFTFWICKALFFITFSEILDSKCCKFMKWCFFYILFYQLYIIKCMIFIVYMPDWSFFKLV